MKWGKEVESRTFPFRQEERLPEREIKDCRELGRQLCAWTEQETGKQGHGEAKPGSLNASQTSRRGDVGEGGCAGGDGKDGSLNSELQCPKERSQLETRGLGVVR